MLNQNGTTQNHRLLFTRFWQSASQFWRGRTSWIAWALTVLLIAIVLLQLFVLYLLNVWNRNFFDALARRDSLALWAEVQIFLPLVASSVLLATLSVWGRMTAQRKWRQSLTNLLVEYWLLNGYYRRIDYAASGHQNPEYRIAEDARVATDAPIDLALGLLSSVLTAITFVEVLWSVGGDISVSIFGLSITIPGYLVAGVIAYSALFTGAMVVVGRSLTDVIQDKNQAEAEFRSAADRLRQISESVERRSAESSKERFALRNGLTEVLAHWRDLCWQLVRTTLISHGNFLLAPVVAWFLCAPKYLAGTMSLGELTQAAAAFVIVQGAFNWLVDNYGRLADWRSSAFRVATLLLALDELHEKREKVDADVAEGAVNAPKTQIGSIATSG